MEPVSDRRLRLLRQSGHLLHRPRARPVADIVRHIVGIQAQDRRAGVLAIRARTTARTAADVEAALHDERSVVWTWLMRGTLHLVTAEDHDWLLALTAPAQLTSTRTRLRQEGISGDQPERAMLLLRRMLAGGPMTAPEIAEGLGRGGIRAEGRAIAHLVRLAAFEGIAFRGPMRGARHTHVLRRDWIGATATPSDPLAELATRYLRAHGPATPADLAAWAGIRVGDARRGWRAIAGRITEVASAHGPMWMLRRRMAEPPTGVVRLAPAFEPFLLGWKRRDFTLSSERASSVVGGGMFRPVILRDGVVTGTWALRRDHEGVRVEVTPFSSRVPRAELAAETRDVSRFLGVPASLHLG